MKRHVYATLIAMIVAIFSSFAQNPQNTTISIAAAANLRDAMNEMKSLYMNENPTIKININYGGSGMLVQQIVNGAGYDIFFSADELYPKRLHDGGYTLNEPVQYACGLLLLYSRSIDVAKSGMKSFSLSNIARIAVANPSAAPYGERAIEAFKNAKIYDTIKNKIIYGENIGATAQYIFSGNADIGIIALSQAKSPSAQSDGYSYLIPEELYSPIIQSCVLIKQKSKKTDATKFLEFVLSEQCQPIWTKYGYKSIK